MLGIVLVGATIRFFVCSVIVDFGVVLLVLLVTWVIWTPKLSQKPMIGLCVKGADQGFLLPNG